MFQACSVPSPEPASYAKTQNSILTHRIYIIEDTTRGGNSLRKLLPDMTHLAGGGDGGE